MPCLVTQPTKTQQLRCVCALVLPRHWQITPDQGLPTAVKVQGTDSVVQNAERLQSCYFQPNNSVVSALVRPATYSVFCF